MLILLSACSFVIVMHSVGLSQVVPEQSSIHQQEFYRNYQDRSSWNCSSDEISTVQEQLYSSSVEQKKSSWQLQNLIPTDRPIVIGYQPYWISATSVAQYDYSVLTHIAYFSGEVDTTTGDITVVNIDRLRLVRDAARSKGAKVLMTITLFGAAQTLKVLSSPTLYRKTLSACRQLILQNSLDGINVDFESVHSTQRTNFTAFITELRDTLSIISPTTHLSIATPAVDWSNTFDFAKLATIADYLVLMGYDYYYSGSQTAGPVAPLKGESYNLQRSVDTYLGTGMDTKKLILGLPWYGYELAVSDSIRKSRRDVLRTGSSVLYTVGQTRSSLYGKKYDTTTTAAWYAYRDTSGWRQGWYDDSLSLYQKYRYAKTKNIRGVAIWALGYQGTQNTLWESLAQGYSLRSITSIDGTIGTPSVEQSKSVMLYPNPATDELTIRSLEQGNATITDMLGRTIDSFPLNSNAVVYNCSAIPIGNFILHIGTSTTVFQIIR